MNPLRPGTVLAGVWGPFTDEGTGLFRTDDGGTSWSPSDTGITAQTVFQVVPHPSKPGGLYALVSCCELWERTGAGQPFTLVPTGIKFPRSLILDPKTPSTRYLVDSSDLYKSVDAGATWRKINSAEGGRVLALKGLLRQYEVMYVVGDERDLIELRTNHRRDPAFRLLG